MSESYSHTDADYDRLQLEVDRLRARVLKYEQQLTITAEGFVMSEDGAQAYEHLREQVNYRVCDVCWLCRRFLIAS